jgi:GTP cyclohydrolase II
MRLQETIENGITLCQGAWWLYLANKVAAYALQDEGLDTVDANIYLRLPEDCRQYGYVPSILKDLGISSI